MQRRLLYAQGILLVAIALLYIYFGLDQSYFWRYSWWDIVLHVLGGAWAALFVGWAAHFFGVRFSVSQYAIAALLVGVGWELFEYTLDIGGSIYMSYPVDTAKDLFDDYVGGLLAGLFVARFLHA